MRLLFDENLSHTLVTRLRDVCAGSEHVRNVGLKSGRDGDIWQYAIDHDLIIVTKDDDFRDLSMLRGHPPKIIWLTLGNCSTDLVERLLRDHFDALTASSVHPDQSSVTLSV